MLSAAYLFLLLTLSLFRNCTCQYNAASVHVIKSKLLYMLMELVMDADMKIEGISYIKKYYSKTREFNIGDMTYNIRVEYAQMLKIYKDTQANLWNPNYGHDYLANSLQRLQHINMDIDKMIQIIELWEKKEVLHEARGHQRAGKLPEDYVDETLMDKVKQKAYMERQKYFWSKTHGYVGMTMKELKEKHKLEAGFKSDIN